MLDPDPPASLAEPGPRDLAVPVTPLDAQRRFGRRAVAAVVLVAAALGVAVTAGQLFPAGVAPTSGATAVTGAATPSEPAAAVRSVAPLPSLLVPPAGWPMISEQPWSLFVGAVRGGSMQGQIALVDGTLVVRRVACTDGDRVCPELSIKGLDLPVSTAPELLPWDRDPPAGATLVLAVADGRLVFLGAIPPDMPHPVAVTSLLDSRRRAPALNDLYPVNGVLLLSSGSCTSSPSGEARSRPGCETTPRLVDGPATPGGRPGEGAAVSLRPQPLAQLGSAVRLGGTFLVRLIDRGACDPSLLPYGASCPEPVIRLQVIALLATFVAVRVTVPTDTTTPGAIAGIVVDPGGKPLAGYRILAGWVGSATGSDSILSHTGADGRFELGGLRQGGWLISVVESSSNPSQFLIASEQVEVVAGATTTVRIVATPGVPWMGG